MKYLYYYHVVDDNIVVYEHEIYAANQEAANRKWDEYKKFHDIIDITKQQEAKFEKEREKG